MMIPPDVRAQADQIHARTAESLDTMVAAYRAKHGTDQSLELIKAAVLTQRVYANDVNLLCELLALAIQRLAEADQLAAAKAKRETK
jgi:hypothetical protein